MLEHDYVVLQAIRKKDDETKMIFQQLALACFDYQLVTEEIGYSTTKEYTLFCRALDPAYWIYVGMNCFPS